MRATFCTIKVSVMKYDAFGFLPKIHFSEKQFIQLFSSSSKFPDLELDMSLGFGIWDLFIFVAPSRLCFLFNHPLHHPLFDEQ